MDRLKRSERIGAMLLLLSRTPNRLVTLSRLSEQFGCAKSTLSEDIASAKGIVEQNGMGRLETVPGAAGGARYLPFLAPQRELELVKEVCETLSDGSRLMSGGYLYTIDVFSDPRTVGGLGEIFARRFFALKPDVVVTVESGGVPIGLMTAQALGCPLVVARKDNRITYGSVVTLNYIATSSKRMQTMSLPRRSIQAGQRALLIDDFTKGGGTVSALRTMMKEFSAEVAGCGTLISAGGSNRNKVGICSLMTLNALDEERGLVDVRPSEWLGRE